MKYTKAKIIFLQLCIYRFHISFVWYLDGIFWCLAVLSWLKPEMSASCFFALENSCSFVLFLKSLVHVCWYMYAVPLLKLSLLYICIPPPQISPSVSYLIFSNPLFGAWPVHQLFGGNKVTHISLLPVSQVYFSILRTKEKPFCLYIYSNSSYRKTYLFVRYVLISKIISSEFKKKSFPYPWPRIHIFTWLHWKLKINTTSSILTMLESSLDCHPRLQNFFLMERKNLN